MNGALISIAAIIVSIVVAVVQYAQWRGLIIIPNMRRAFLTKPPISTERAGLLV
jgi:hypothetical protein